jgi:hypothetical protein
MAKKKSAPAKVESIRHKDKRTSLPTGNRSRKTRPPWYNLSKGGTDHGHGHNQEAELD